MKLAWINLFVNDVKKTSAWYTEVLGFKEVHGSPKFIMLAGKGGVQLSFHEGQPLKNPERVQLHFEVDNVDKAYKSLKKKGVEFNGPPKTMSWGWRHAYFKDPAGHTLEIVQQL